MTSVCEIPTLLTWSTDRLSMSNNDSTRVIFAQPALTACRKCPRTVYIGETGHRLADPFKEQRLDVLHKKNDLPVAQHINGPGHSLEDVRVAMPKSGLAKKDVRQRGEMRQTRAPRGINCNFSFL